MRTPNRPENCCPSCFAGYHGQQGYLSTPQCKCPCHERYQPNRPSAFLVLLCSIAGTCLGVLLVTMLVLLTGGHHAR